MGASPEPPPTPPASFGGMKAPCQRRVCILHSSSSSEDTEEEKTYQIVGEPEADVRSGRVSVTSPIARALMGKTVGDTVEVSTPGGGKSYEVVGVRF